LDEKAIRGVPWTMLSYAGTRAVSVVTTIVLARLLVPADFGLFALATLGTGFISIFSGLGLGSALVLRQDLDRRGQGTVLSLLLLAGLLFAIVLAGLSPLAAELFREPRLEDVLLALAGILSISGLNWFYDSLLSRELEFRRRFAAQMIRTVAFSAVALVLAIAGEGVWALVGAHIAGHLANTVAQIGLAPYRVRPAWDRRHVGDILRTGSGFVLQDGSAFLQQNADYVIVGRVLGTAQLGFYSMAYRQSELPYAAVAEPVARVTFPAFARMRANGQDVMPEFLSALRMVALVSLPLGIMLSAAAAPFTHALFGPKWPPMIGPLAVLGLWAVLRPLEATVASVLNSIGHAGFVGRISIGLLVPQAIALVVAASALDITAVAWVMVAHISIVLILVTLMVQRVTGTSARTQWRAVQPLVIAGAASWLATRAVSEALAGTAPALALAAAVVVDAAVYLLAVRLLAPGILREALHLAGRALGRRRSERAVAVG
jgi:lipopolysaccharide exporter